MSEKTAPEIPADSKDPDSYGAMLDQAFEATREHLAMKNCNCAFHQLSRKWEQDLHDIWNNAPIDCPFKVKDDPSRASQA